MIAAARAFASALRPFGTGASDDPPNLFRLDQNVPPGRPARHPVLPAAARAGGAG